jgi:hypothetical protein
MRYNLKHDKAVRKIYYVNENENYQKIGTTTKYRELCLPIYAHLIWH